jgi:WD40 repeat protein
MTRTRLLTAFVVAACVAVPAVSADLEPEVTYKGHKEVPVIVSFLADGKRVASASEGEIRVWGGKEPVVVTHQSNNDYHWSVPRFASDGKTLAVFKSPRNVGEFALLSNYSLGDKIEGGSAVSMPPQKVQVPADVAFSPDRKVMAVACSENSEHRIVLYDLETKDILNTIHKGDTRQRLSFSPDGKTLVSVDDKGKVILWKTSSGKQRSSFDMKSAPVNDLAIDPDSKVLVTAGNDKTVKLWDLEKGDLKHTLTGHTAPVLCLAVSRDGKYLASGGKDQNILIWDALAGKKLAAIEGHLNDVTCLAFSADGKKLVSGGADKYVRVWDVTKALKE